ncbi:DUF1636 family protein [Pseudooceanicola algae]|uniref:Metal-binding protein n=1 Tax=Pseudooceanicola algae TaxID=1537215 RepID=A0A418SDT0_9RHOB|nr:DUF1636 family protein [Pseudooceanicola algae]QPM91044.1 hypothetical protein PSAL_022870 [Pseudooceanicola algae]
MRPEKGDAVISVCANCEGGVALYEALGALVGDEPLRLVPCMNACAQGGALAIREPGREAYLFGGVSAAMAPDLVTFLRLYRAAPKGRIEDARPMGALRHCLIGRIPA